MGWESSKVEVTSFATDHVNGQATDPAASKQGACFQPGVTYVETV